MSVRHVEYVSRLFRGDRTRNGPHFFLGCAFAAGPSELLGHDVSRSPYPTIVPSLFVRRGFLNPRGMVKRREKELTRPLLPSYYDVACFRWAKLFSSSVVRGVSEESSLLK
ncbi:hypothetical protein F2Q68_00025249 [Brassica cretica]|uniref:Uncharacterized protein n=2 Tax=Brassica cretica TaxID=69181 RepID=A0A8S9IFI2_BRACR|nr:hypothetical protein F2Q68_00025249 [Brassica cretica]KAF3580386.1 hypothetical protein DY000_02030873 [Brassica cretica]